MPEHRSVELTEVTVTVGTFVQVPAVCVELVTIGADGGVVSVTTTLCVEVAVIPPAKRAVHSIVFVPSGSVAGSDGDVVMLCTPVSAV